MILLLLFLVGVVIVIQALFGLGHRGHVCRRNVVQYLKWFVWFPVRYTRVQPGAIMGTSRVLCFAALVCQAAALCEYQYYLLFIVLQ